MRIKTITACICMLLVSACGHEDRTALVRNGFWADNKVNPISSAVDTWQGCFSGTQSWVTEYDENDRATVLFSCRLKHEYAGRLLDLMKSLNTLASRHTSSQSEFRSIFAQDLSKASGLKEISLKMRFPVKSSRSFDADAQTPVFSGLWADGTELPIGKITTADMVNAMFRIPMVKDAEGKMHVLDASATFAPQMQNLLRTYMGNKGIDFQVTRIKQDGKTYNNLNDNNGRPATIEYPYYKVTGSTVDQALDSLLVPNVFQCNRWYEAHMRQLLANSPRRGEFEAFNSLCRMDSRMDPGYTTTTRLGYEVVSDRQYVAARRFMYQLHNNFVTEESCVPKYWQDAYDIVQEFGSKEAKARSDSEIALWQKTCAARTSENGYGFLRKAALFKAATPYVCSSSILKSMLELSESVHLSDRDRAFIKRKFAAIEDKCSAAERLDGIAKSPESRNWLTPIEADEEKLRLAANVINGYVTAHFCKAEGDQKNQCGKPEYRERLKSDEFAAFKKLGTADSGKYAQIEELVCGDLGYCSYGILSDIYFAEAPIEKPAELPPVRPIVKKAVKSKKAAVKKSSARQPVKKAAAKKTAAKKTAVKSTTAKKSSSKAK